MSPEERLPIRHLAPSRVVLVDNGPHDQLGKLSARRGIGARVSISREGDQGQSTLALDRDDNLLRRLTLLFELAHSGANGCDQLVARARTFGRSMECGAHLVFASLSHLRSRACHWTSAFGRCFPATKRYRFTGRRVPMVEVGPSATPLARRRSP